MPNPYPWKIREDVEEIEIEDFYQKDWVLKSVGDRSDKMDAIVKWALSYQKAFEIVKDSMLTAHEAAIRQEDALRDVRFNIEGMAKECGNSFRLFGAVCQGVKVRRFFN